MSLVKRIKIWPIFLTELLLKHLSLCEVRKHALAELRRFG